MVDNGLSFKDDIASIWKDPTYLDVTIVCADGVQLGAYWLQDAKSSKRCCTETCERVPLNTSSSSISTPAVLNIVLGFIHTETIDNTVDISTAVGIYCAANFLLLPKLMKTVLERAHDIADFGVASSLLNEAVASIPWSVANKDLYDVLPNPFCAHKLSTGELTDLSEEALELLLTEAAIRATPEHDLLLCVVDWVWARDDDTPSASERHAVLHDINDMVLGSKGMIQLGDGVSSALLLKMMSHFDLKLICTH